MDRNESAPAIVIKSERYKERDRLITVLSPIWGVRKLVVYGAQKSRKAIRAPLYTEATFHVYNNRERHHTSLVDLNPISIHENLSSSLEASFSAALISEVILVQKGADAQDYYNLILSCFDVLNDNNYRKIVTQFLIRALEIAGLSTDYEICPICGRRYGEGEILGFNANLASPCCANCDSMNQTVILPPSARRYVRDSLLVTLERALLFKVSLNMEIRLMRYAIRVYQLSAGCSLKSSSALLELDN